MPDCTCSCPRAAVRAIADGETFTIRNSKTAAAVIFEFDKNGSVVAGRRAVTINNGQNQDAVAAALITAINASGLGLTPTYSGNGDVNLATVDFLVDLTGATNLRQTGISNGQTFVVDNGIKLSKFEFSSELGQGLLPSGNIRVTIPSDRQSHHDCQQPRESHCAAQI